MNRPSLTDLLITIRNTVELQIANSSDGKLLLATYPVSVAALVTRIVNNLAQVVDGLFDAAGFPENGGS